MKYILTIALITLLTSCAAKQHDYICYTVLPIGEVKHVPKPKFLCLRDDIAEQVQQNQAFAED